MYIAIYFRNILLKGRFHMGTIDRKIHKEVFSVLNMSPDERTKQYQLWLETATEESYLKCFYLAIQLRKKRLNQEAFNVSKALTEESPSLQSFNMYLISASDLNNKGELDISELNSIFEQAWEFSKDKEYEPNIVATMLKCCNRLIEYGLSTPTMFDEIYSNWDETASQNNSFILTQYFTRLLSDGKKEEVIRSFEQLPAELQTNQALIKLYKECSALPTLNVVETKLEQKVTVISSPSIITSLATTLISFSIQTGGIGIPSEDLSEIIEKLNQGTYKASFAIIVIPKDFGEDACIWSFVLGYCVHKFGKNNILLFAEDISFLESSPLSTYLTQFQAQSYGHDMDVVKLLGERKILSVTK